MATKQAKSKTVVMTGAYYIKEKFVSKAFVKTALEATGRTVLDRPPKDDNDVLLVTGKVLGKRDKTVMHVTAEKRGIPVEELDDLVNARFLTALGRSLRASDKLLPSEKALLDDLSKKKSAA